MTTLTFSIDIKASKEQVWKILWNDSSYREWTSVFSEGSYAVTDNWKEGSKVQFLAPGGDGMYSRINKHIPTEIMAFQHMGVIKEGKELLPDAKSEQWTGAKEVYTLSKKNNHTNLAVSIDVTNDFRDYFTEKFPIALNKIKSLAER